MAYQVVTYDTRNGKRKSVSTSLRSAEAAHALANASNAWNRLPRNHAPHLTSVVEVQ